ncbi:MAG TPA: hypothetical protein V6D22_07550 [Candidatus Obscuribacterales bacterium]
MTVERRFWWNGEYEKNTDEPKKPTKIDFLTAGQAAEAIRADDVLFPVVIERHTQIRLIVESPYTNSKVEFIGPIADLCEIRAVIKYRPRKVRKTGPSERRVAAALLDHRGAVLNSSKKNKKTDI